MSWFSRTEDYSIETTAVTSIASPKSSTVPPMTPHRAAHHQQHPAHGMTISMSANTSLPAVISTLANLHHSPLL